MIHFICENEVILLLSIVSVSIEISKTYVLKNEIHSEVIINEGLKIKMCQTIILNLNMIINT